MRGGPKTATVLFTDVVGSTELAGRLGPVAAGELIERHFAALRDSLSVHRGVCVKTLGDGIMAVFDSVTDGVACAVTMQRAVARQNRLASVAPLAIRVGVSIGEATRDGEDYFGGPVVEASRLCACARPHGILVSDVARMLAGGGPHRLQPAGALELKGIANPVVAWEVDWGPGEEFALRVALADDSVLFRQGIASVLQAAGIDVVLQASDAETLLRALVAVRPHVVILDVRMPPTHTTEGLDAAERIRAVASGGSAIDPEVLAHLDRAGG